MTCEEGDGDRRASRRWRTTSGNFASGGLIGLVATETSEPTKPVGGEPAAIVTVIYKPPKDTGGVREVLRRDPRAAGRREPAGDRLHQGRADQVRVQPRRLRPASSTGRPSCTSPRWTRSRRAPPRPAFKKVADDLANFASGGLDALIGGGDEVAFAHRHPRFPTRLAYPGADPRARSARAHAARSFRTRG